MFQKHSFQRFAGGFLLFVWSLLLAQPADAALFNGSRGENVLHLQQALAKVGFFSGKADGIFGPLTEDAVIRFQQENGLTPDGIAGPKTEEALHLSTEAEPPARENGHTIWVKATGYCPCNRCNYPYGGQPSCSGLPLEHGIVAIDPSVIPMGSALSIPGYGDGIAADTGNAIKGNRIDLCFATHNEALAWGVQTIPITVYPK